MQYIPGEIDELKDGQTSYFLHELNGTIRLWVSTEDKNISDAQEKRLAAHKRGYFLRKGFSEAIRHIDPDVVQPIYTDMNDQEVYPKSTDEALDQIYHGDGLNISGFRFKETATKAQKEEAYGKIIDCFVSTSKNPDLRNENNLFYVWNGVKTVGYNNGGDSKKDIKGVDIQEKLGLNTPEVIVEKRRREALAAKREQQQ